MPTFLDAKPIRQTIFYIETPTVLSGSEGTLKQLGIINIVLREVIQSRGQPIFPSVKHDRSSDHQ